MNKEEIINSINKFILNSGTITVNDKHLLDYIKVSSYEIIIDVDKYYYKEGFFDCTINPIYYKNIKGKYLLKILQHIRISKFRAKCMSKEGIIKEINKIIEEYGDFSSYDIDKYLTIDELKCGRVYVIAKNYEVGKVYCEILFCEDVLDEEYYDYNILDIKVLKEILEYCNIYKQECIGN